MLAFEIRFWNKLLVAHYGSKPYLLHFVLVQLLILHLNLQLAQESMHDLKIDIFGKARI